MLLSGYLDEEKMILADPENACAKFFLFRQGKFLGKGRKIFQGATYAAQPIWLLP
jgi:hypothetical protein